MTPVSLPIHALVLPRTLDAVKTEEVTICDMNRIYEPLLFHVVRRKGERVDGESGLGPPSRSMS